MVKKGTKRKTRWRTLSIGDGGTDTPDTGKTEIKQEQNECLTSTSNTNLSTYTRKSSLHTTPFHQRNGDRNHYFRTSDRYPSQPHTRTQSQDENLHRSTPYSYKRRPFYPSSRYYGNTNSKSNPSTNNRPYPQPDTLDNKENTTTKPLFNADDYTRITTPRQDVLFKKGYLSRPKKTITPTDTTVSSSTTVSVVSTEDSGTQSLSPEHCSSTPEIFDPDHPLMYPGFYDENGVFFINPFMPNGFDPYDDPLIMMPYGGGSPFSINPSEYCNSDHKPQNLYQKRNSVDSENSPESPSSQNESASSTPAIDDLCNEPSQNEDVPTESQSEGDAPKPMEGEITPNECNHIMPMQYYYPFMYGPPPFSPIDEYNGNTAQYVNSYGTKYNRFKKRKRRPFKYGNSTGVSATTTDYSEDEDSIEENNRVLGLAVQPNNIEKTPCLTIAQCDDIISRTTLNTNVSEFVPKHLQSSPSRTTLNVEVEEFHPRNYTPIVQPESTTEAADASPTDTLTKQMSPESRKVTILPRTAPAKHTQPSKTSKDAPEQMNAQVTPAIDKSSTLISSISSRDKNDDNVNGVDNHKKIEKLVDPVNIKADLDDKVVMHPKQQENILENVKKTKFKSTKFNKSSPRKTNSGPKKDGKIGKGAITNGKCVSVTVAANEHPQPMESKPTDVDNRNVVDECPEKSNQPTYAQMVGPVAKPKTTSKIARTEVGVHSIKENIEPVSAGELKIVEAIDEIKPALKVETKWQTVRPKGKKKLFSVVCEEPNDEWNDFDEEKPVDVKKLNKVTEPQTVQVNLSPTIDGSTQSAVPAKVKPPKTEKVKTKSKAKKSQKKMKEKLVELNGTSEDENKQSQNGTSTPKDDKMRSVSPIIDDLFGGDGHEFLNDIDISNFSFETSPSMFLNAITNITNGGIYTDNSLTGKSSAGFALNNSLKLLNTFDFCKTKENALLKEEEEMVIRVLQSLNQTDSQVVGDNVKRCNNIVEDVKSCNDVKIQKTIFDVVDGQNDTHSVDEDDGKKIETVGAETLDVKNEMNCNGNAVNKDAKGVNGHRIEDINISGNHLNEKVDDDEHQAETNPKIEPLTNGHKFNENNGEEMDVKESKETNGHQIEDINLDKVTEPTQTKSKVEPITNGNHSSNKINGEEIDVSAEPVPSETGTPMDETNDLDVTIVADEIETDMRMIDRTLVDENDEDINKDCTTNIKSDDEVHSDLSELSDENDETIVSRSNDYFEYDEMETVREIDVAELVDDLQFDDVIDDFVVDNDDEMTIRNDENELMPHNDIKIHEILAENEPLPRPSSQNLFIENEAVVLNTEITLTDIEITKCQDRIQSPRNSEDSGILDNQDDGRYFSESDNDKTEQTPAQNFPLTEAVSRWLEEKQKEKSPEPVIRLPDDPELSHRIEKSIMSSGMHITQFFDNYEDETSEESDTEFEVPTASKNLLSNPLRVLFRKQNDTATSSHSANGIRKRVAKFNLESDKSSIMVDEPDILEYWENDPMLQSQNSNSNSNVLNNGQKYSSSIDTGLDAYESVYGKTIDYAKLSANIHNDDVFLSNNILNNDKLSKLPINPINNNTDSSLPHARSLSGKNDTNSNNKNLNCFKPPEICCMLM